MRVQVTSPILALLMRAFSTLFALNADEGLRGWQLVATAVEPDAVPALARTLANECKQRRRNRWWSIVRSASPHAEDSAPQATPEAALDLRRALSRLPVDMKLAIVLRYYLDLPFDEVGRVLKVSDKAARARVHRALVRLRVEIPEVLEDA